MDRLPDELEIWRGLLLAQRSMVNRVAGELKHDFDLTLAQFEALLMVWQNGGEISVGELAATIVYSQGSATHLVMKLEERGLVERITGMADARRVTVRITPIGEEHIIAAATAHRKTLMAQFAPLIAPEERDVLLRFARRYAAAEGTRTQPATADEDHQRSE